MVTIRQAKPEECDGVNQFYCDLIDSMHNIEFKPAWKMGVYPTEQLIRNAINEQTLFIAILTSENTIKNPETGEIIVGAMILNHDCADEYKNAKWRIEAKKEEVMVIHLLAVSLFYQGKGIAKQMMSNAIEICKKDSIKAIRLDILSTNSPAEKLYLSMGFNYVGTVKMFYEDTGLTDFILYELVL